MWAGWFADDAVRVNDVENDVFNDEEVETNDVSTILENSAGMLVVEREKVNFVLLVQGSQVWKLF